MTDNEQGWIASKIIGPKKEWRAYKRRVKALPVPYATAVAGIERYLMHFGAINDADSITNLFGDVIDIFERAAADNTPIRDIVGEDPVEFADALIRNYQATGYVAREKARLAKAIDEAVEAQDVP
jgi:DNA-binding ferritin-like protein (Dps family)